MYAVIKTGGKQYKVAAGEKLKIEQIPAEIGSEISQGRHDKVTIFKMRRRKHYQKHQGHRQNYTEILINTIKA